MARQIKYGRYLHGGDYNPEQWLDRPDILQKDIEYFKKAHINTVSVGIFSWAVLEPEEGKYNFDWLEEIINNLYKEEFIPFLQLRQEQDRNGWQTNTKKSFVWTRTEQEDSSAADITTASPLRYTEKKYMRLIRN